MTSLFSHDRAPPAVHRAGSAIATLTFELALAAAACGPRVSAPRDDGGASESTPTGGPGTTSVGTASAGTAITTATSTSGQDTVTTIEASTAQPSTGSDEDSDCSFLIDCRDIPRPTVLCDPISQDCPVREKCNLFDADGENTLNGTACVPVVIEPALPGDPCHVIGPPMSGTDDCAVGSICLGFDPETLEGGRCVEFCLDIGRCPDLQICSFEKSLPLAIGVCVFPE